MMNRTMPKPAPVVLITGAARRIGAAIAIRLHGCGYRVIIHYQNSAADAERLCSKLNAMRADSAHSLQANLLDIDSVEQLAKASITQWGQLNALVNNASSFYPTPLPRATNSQWDELIGSNLKGPFFLCQALSKELTKQCGSIVNISDIHAHQPLKDHSIYCIAKAGNKMLTKTLAKEFAPNVRVNGIAPGVILWPENDTQKNNGQEQLIKRIPLQRMGSSDDIARLAEFFITSASYITGQNIAVDGGKSLN
ncbi:pteridine reductase [Gammaproteobacteria bacterium 50_400_T64]|nr:pteridine reductase [Gammaproteobacteria bacterium 50_400_T64]